MRRFGPCVVLGRAKSLRVSSKAERKTQSRQLQATRACARVYLAHYAVTDDEGEYFEVFGVFRSCFERQLVCHAQTVGPILR